MNMQKLSRVTFVIAAAALLLGACASNEPPGYTRGWADGCSSGYLDGHGREYGGVYYKDKERYQSDAQYRKGWDDAYERCYAMPYPMMKGL